MNESDEIITERNETDVNILNKKFQSVFVKEDNNDFSNLMTEQNKNYNGTGIMK
jgi:hypothetical protein